jgi:hypothetical protein
MLSVSNAAGLMLKSTKQSSIGAAHAQLLQLQLVRSLQQTVAQLEAHRTELQDKLELHTPDIHRGQRRLLLLAFHGWRSFVWARQRLSCKLQAVFRASLSADEHGGPGWTLPELFRAWRRVIQQRRQTCTRLMLTDHEERVHDEEIDLAMCWAKTEEKKRLHVEARLQAVLARQETNEILQESRRMRAVNESLQQALKKAHDEIRELRATLEREGEETSELRMALKIATESSRRHPTGHQVK